MLLRTTKILFSLAACIVLSSTSAIAADEKKQEEIKAPKKATTTLPVDGDKQTTCSINIYYTWKRTPGPITYHDAATGKSIRMKPDSALVEPIDVYFSELKEKGKSEEEIASKLTKKLEMEKSKAVEECNSKHQQESKCMLEGIKSITKEYKLMDYPSRKQLLDSIRNDCARSIGVCMGTKTSELSCQEPPKAAEEEPKRKRR